MFLVNYESKFLPYIMSYQLTYDQIHFPKTPSVHINNAQYNSDMNCILGFNDDNNLVQFIAPVVNEDNVISYNLYNSVGFYNTGQTILKYGVKQQLLQKTINH